MWNIRGSECFRHAIVNICRVVEQNPPGLLTEHAILIHASLPKRPWVTPFPSIQFEIANVVTELYQYPREHSPLWDKTEHTESMSWPFMAVDYISCTLLIARLGAKCVDDV